jgi:hypothetical protein
VPFPAETPRLKLGLFFVVGFHPPIDVAVDEYLGRGEVECHELGANGGEGHGDR